MSRGDFENEVDKDNVKEKKEEDKENKRGK